MHDDVERAARENLARLLESDIDPDQLDLDFDLAGEYGLTSLNKVLFLTSVCDETNVDLSHFTEQDVARMHTLRDVTSTLRRYTERVS